MEDKKTKSSDWMDKKISFCWTGGYLTQDELKSGYETFYKSIGEVSGIGIYECNNECKGCPSKVSIYRSDSETGMAGSSIVCANLRTEIGKKIKCALQKGNLRLAEKLLDEFNEIFELM